MSDYFNVGELTVSGGFFLVNRDSKEPLAFSAMTSAGDDYEHIFTYQNSGSTIKEQALRLIRDARHKIFIASFRIGDKDLLDELNKAVERLRGGVYVISALDERSLARGLAELDDEADVDIQAQKKDFAALARNGIYVRGHESCHAKFIVIDDQRALVSSANLETSAFQRVNDRGFHRGPTGENGVLVRDRRQVGKLSRLFARMWAAECTWELLPARIAAVVSARTPSNPCCGLKYQKPTQGGMVWTDNNENFILDVIHDTIRETRQNLILSTFSLNRMSENPEILIEPLARLIKDRSPEVRILLRVRNHFGTHRRDAVALASLGVRIFGDDLNHAKGVISDYKKGLLFSANFDANHGLRSGVEVGVMLPAESNAVRDAASFFEHSIACSRFRFAVDPSHEELAQDLAASWPQQWPYDKDLCLTESQAAWQVFREEAQVNPVLFSASDGSPITLHVGRTDISLVREPEADCRYRMTVLNGSCRNESSADLLERWLGSHGPREQGGGICGAKFYLSS